MTFFIVLLFRTRLFHHHSYSLCERRMWWLCLQINAHCFVRFNKQCLLLLSLLFISIFIYRRAYYAKSSHGPAILIYFYIISMFDLFLFKDRWFSTLYHQVNQLSCRWIGTFWWHWPLGLIEAKCIVGHYIIQIVWIHIGRMIFNEDIIFLLLNGCQNSWN